MEIINSGIVQALKIFSFPKLTVLIHFKFNFSIGLDFNTQYKTQFKLSQCFYLDFLFFLKNKTVKKNRKRLAAFFQHTQHMLL